MAEVQTEYLPNTSLEHHYLYTCLFGRLGENLCAEIGFILNSLWHTIVPRQTKPLGYL